MTSIGNDDRDHSLPPPVSIANATNDDDPRHHCHPVVVHDGTSSSKGKRSTITRRTVDDTAELTNSTRNSQHQDHQCHTTVWNDDCTMDDDFCSICPLPDDVPRFIYARNRRVFPGNISSISQPHQISSMTLVESSSSNTTNDTMIQQQTSCLPRRNKPTTRNNNNKLRRLRQRFWLFRSRVAVPPPQRLEYDDHHHQNDDQKEEMNRMMLMMIIDDSETSEMYGTSMVSL